MNRMITALPAARPSSIIRKRSLGERERKSLRYEHDNISRGQAYVNMYDVPCPPFSHFLIITMDSYGFAPAEWLCSLRRHHQTSIPSVTVIHG